MLRGFLRQFFGICNLGLVKKNNLKSFQKNNTSYNNLVRKKLKFGEIGIGTEILRISDTKK